jgi:outer membrane lipoprotein LolB
MSTLPTTPAASCAAALRGPVTIGRIRRLLLGTFGLLWLQLLPACSTPAPSRVAAPADPLASGRLMVRIEAHGGQAAQSFSAAFELFGTGHSGELRLLSPLGTRMATAQWSSAQVRLSTPQGEQNFANLDELAQQVLGQAVPLGALPDWLAGRPWAAAPHEPTPTGFLQLGWQLDTTAFGSGQLEARRPASPAVLLRVRLDAAG